MKILDIYRKQIPVEYTSRGLDYKYSGFTLADIEEALMFVENDIKTAIQLVNDLKVELGDNDKLAELRSTLRKIYFNINKTNE